MIKMVEITKKQPICEAFGLADEQADVIKRDILRAFENASVWTECIKQTLSDKDTPLVEAFKMLTIGELIGTMKQYERNVI